MVNRRKIYNVVTLDYLAEGTTTWLPSRAISRTDTGVTLRDIMIDYVLEQTRRGNEITSSTVESPFINNKHFR